VNNPIAESLPYDSPVPDELQWQPAWHAVIHVLLPHTDKNGTLVVSTADAEDYISETLRGQFLDWGYVRAIDPETGEPVEGESGMQGPLRIHVLDPYIEGTFGYDEESADG
jgi:hypothetical protein